MRIRPLRLLPDFAQVFVEITDDVSAARRNSSAAYTYSANREDRRSRRPVELF